MEWFHVRALRPALICESSTFDQHLHAFYTTLPTYTSPSILTGRSCLFSPTSIHYLLLIAPTSCLPTTIRIPLRCSLTSRILTKSSTLNGPNHRLGSMPSRITRHDLRQPTTRRRRKRHHRNVSQYRVRTPCFDPMVPMTMTMTITALHKPSLSKAH
jgi:hypothetical protein